ncbi:hypothetical protein O1611_g7490 [Lasiodiplodia mahajangana]|uniref:Uncharacterized protein n=1 Tax=Lasiodiplodia mahajangana TaxID=1108764 RepID=A0ACC2JF95_9PEZI|nr:hypothetical protein O1611_g7490 [Lasiodiplodia mahajangana]
MLGFAYTFPINGSATATRKSIDMAITVIEMYQDVLPEAGPVAAIGRALADHVGTVIMDIGTGDSSWSSLPSTSSTITPIAPSYATLDVRAAAAADAQTSTSNLLVPAADPAPVQQDWNMMDMTAMPFSMDKMLGRGAMNQLSEEVVNIEAMDVLWPGLASGDVPNADWWMSMGDSIT